MNFKKAKTKDLANVLHKVWTGVYADATQPVIIWDGQKFSYTSLLNACGNDIVLVNDPESLDREGNNAFGWAKILLEDQRRTEEFMEWACPYLSAPSPVPIFSAQGAEQKNKRRSSRCRNKPGAGVEKNITKKRPNVKRTIEINL